MQKSSLFQYLYIFNSFVFVLFVVNIFINSEALNYVIGLCAIWMIIFSYTGASRLFKVLGSAFIGIVLLLYIESGQPLADLPHELTANMSLLVLLAMLPWMNSVVRSGRFDRSLNALLKVNVSYLGKLYMRSSAITLILAAFLNLSAATISQEVLKKNLAHTDKKLRNSFISLSTLRGFSLALLWSPLEILLAVTIFVTSVSYGSLLSWLLLIALITFVFDVLWGRFHFKKHSYVSPGDAETEIFDLKALGKKIIHLFIALALFLTLVILLGHLLNLDFILTVSLLIFPFSFIWSIMMKRRWS